MEKKNLDLKLSIEIASLPYDIWHVITNPQMVERFFIGFEIDTDWRLGSFIKIRGMEEGIVYEEVGKVTEVKREEKLAFHTPRHGDITYRIIAGENNSRLIITQTGISSEKEHDIASNNWLETLKNIKELLEGKV